MKHKLIVYPLIGILVIVAGLFGLWYWMGMAGTSPLERWIGKQVKSIAGSYLNPRVDFDDLDYQRPYTVVLTKFRLTVDDTDNVGKTLDVIYVDKLRLELAEIPEEGKPIRIEKLILDHPKINAIAARHDGKFMGFENMLKSSAASGSQPAQEQATRLSDVFQIVLLQIIEGQVVYESRGSGQPPMILDAINSRMDVQKDEQGWYKLAAKLDRKPVFDLTANGRLDLDSLVLALDSLQLNIELGQQQYSKLPGQIQQMLKEHEVIAKLKLAASGRVPLGDPVSGDLTTTLSMDEIHFVVGDYKGHAQNVSSKVSLKDRRVVLEHLDADTLKGKVHLDANVAMVDPFDGRVHLTAKDIRLEETLRAAGGSEAKYKGTVNADVTLTGPMNNILTRAGGNGRPNLNNLILALDSLQLNIELGQQQYSKLPGQIPQMLKEHEVAAKLQLAASGRVPLSDPLLGDLTTTLSMDEIHFVVGDYKGQAQNVSSKVSLKDRRVVLEHLDADTLKGKVHLDANVAMVAPFDGRVHLTAKDILLEEMLRAAGGGESKYKGVVNTDVTLTGSMNNILTRAGGNGWLKLRNGRLVELPVIADIGQALAQSINLILSGPKQNRTDTDSADLEFKFVGDKVHFTKILAQTSSFAVNGHGDVWFNKRLDLLLNGGPVDKLQSVLSGGGIVDNQVTKAVGNVLHKVGSEATGIATDVFKQVATVVVVGTIDAPQVRVEPFRNITDALGGK